MLCSHQMLYVIETQFFIYAAPLSESLVEVVNVKKIEIDLPIVANIYAFAWR